MAVVGNGGVVLLPGEAARVDVGSFDVLVHATGEQTAGAFSLVETAEPKTRVGPPLHVHRDAAESFYVLEGEYVMHLDGREFRCAVGSFVYVPAGMTHTFWTSAAPSRKLNLYTPSAMDGYFEEFGQRCATASSRTASTRSPNVTRWRSSVRSRIRISRSRPKSGGSGVTGLHGYTATRFTARRLERAIRPPR